MSILECCQKWNEHAPNCITVKYRELETKLATLEEVRKAAQMVWDAGMITVNDETDRGRCERLKDALEKAREK